MKHEYVHVELEIESCRTWASVASSWAISWCLCPARPFWEASFGLKSLTVAAPIDEFSQAQAWRAAWWSSAICCQP